MAMVGVLVKKHLSIWRGRPYCAAKFEAKKFADNVKSDVRVDDMTL
jgi:hypothetical protein